MSSRSLVLKLSLPALLCIGLAVPPAITTADAQTKPVSRMRFQALDRNNDGRITRAEWNGNDRSFQNHDWNGDGELSGNEVRPGAQRNTELADHNPNIRERNLNWTQANFNALDHNRDRRLSANEWHFDLGTFRRVDRDRNDSISLQEFLGGDRLPVHLRDPGGAGSALVAADEVGAEVHDHRERDDPQNPLQVLQVLPEDVQHGSISEVRRKKARMVAQRPVPGNRRA